MVAIFILAPKEVFMVNGDPAQIQESEEIYEVPTHTAPAWLGTPLLPFVCVLCYAIGMLSSLIVLVAISETRTRVKSLRTESDGTITLSLPGDALDESFIIMDGDGDLSRVSGATIQFSTEKYWIGFPIP